MEELKEKLRKFAEGAKDGEIKATRPIVGILHRRMEKQTLLRYCALTSVNLKIQNVQTFR